MDKEGVQGFVKLINDLPSENNDEHCKLGLSQAEVNSYWELGYEVCFYRDIGHPKENNISLKRTFDFCLFSEKKVIIIEAKAHQSFDSNQINDINSDKSKVAALLRLNDEDVSVVGLISSLYSPRSKYFNTPYLTWKHLEEKYHDEILSRADYVYNKQPVHIPSTKTPR